MSKKRVSREVLEDEYGVAGDLAVAEESFPEAEVSIPQPSDADFNVASAKPSPVVAEPEPDRPLNPTEVALILNQIQIQSSRVFGIPGKLLDEDRLRELIRVKLSTRWRPKAGGMSDVWERLDIMPKAYRDVCSNTIRQALWFFSALEVMAGDGAA